MMPSGDTFWIWPIYFELIAEPMTEYIFILSFIALNHKTYQSVLYIFLLFSACRAAPGFVSLSSIIAVELKDTMLSFHPDQMQFCLAPKLNFGNLAFV